MVYNASARIPWAKAYSQAWPKYQYIPFIRMGQQKLEIKMQSITTSKFF